jgi:hypothetical protein
VASDINPATDNLYDLGVTGHEWRDLNIDGTANIDSLVADTADIDGGTIDATSIGATTPAAGSFTTLAATGVTTLTGAVRITQPATTATLPFAITGDGYSGGSSAGGVGMILGYNGTGNRQAWFGSTDDLGNAAKKFLRFIGGGEVFIDAINGNGSVGSAPQFPNGISVTGGTLAVTGASTLSGGINNVVPSVDDTATGNTTSAYNCGYSSSAIGDLVYLDSSATWQKADYDTLANYSGLLAVALEVKASGAALKVALPGSIIYASAIFPTFTIGSPIYVGATAAVTQTQPTATDRAIRVVGWAVHADKMYFNPSPDYITNT